MKHQSLSLLTMLPAILGFQYYSPSTEICCDSKVWPSNQGSCCGSEIYNFKTHVCCDHSNSLITRKPLDIENADAIWECCGGVAYDRKENVCCNNNIIKKIPYIENGRADTDNYLSFSCCNDKVHNQRKQICCSGKLVYGKAFLSVGKSYINSHSPCCGAIAYNPDTQQCCDGINITVKKTSSSSCCGKSSYDYNYQVCTDMHVVRPVLKNGIYCGYDIIEAGSPDFCCNGVIIKNPQNNKRCCGKQVAEGNSELCCGEFAMKKLTEFHECCDGTKNLYDNRKEICCGLEIVQIPSENPSMALCCKSSF